MGDDDLAYIIQLLMEDNHSNENNLAQIFEQMTSNTINHNQALNTNIHALNNLSLNPPRNPTTSLNPPSVLNPTQQTLVPPPQNNMSTRVAMPPPQEPYYTCYYRSHFPNPLDPNWEAIGAFLSGQVRMGPDDRVYRCIMCNVEFANAQALGGHMSSHTKNRKAKKGSFAHGTGCRSTKTFKKKGRK